MRLEFSVILVVAKQLEGSNSHPKGIGNVASRQGLSYRIEDVCSRPISRRSMAAGHARSAGRQTAEGLYVVGQGADLRGPAVGLVLRDGIDRPPAAGTEGGATDLEARRPRKHFLSGLHQTVDTMDHRPGRLFDLGTESEDGAKLSRTIPYRRLSGPGGRRQQARIMPY